MSEYDYWRNPHLRQVATDQWRKAMEEAARLREKDTPARRHRWAVRVKRALTGGNQNCR